MTSQQISVYNVPQNISPLRLLKTVKKMKIKILKITWLIY